jgi:hypothetical protein
LYFDIESSIIRTTVLFMQKGAIEIKVVPEIAEAALRLRLDRTYIYYLIAREINKEGKNSGTILAEELESRIKSSLGDSDSTIRRTLKDGEGIFWDFQVGTRRRVRKGGPEIRGKRLLRLHGIKAVLEYFDIDSPKHLYKIELKAGTKLQGIRALLHKVATSSNKGRVMSRRVQGTKIDRCRGTTYNYDVAVNLSRRRNYSISNGVAWEVSSTRYSNCETVRSRKLREYRRESRLQRKEGRETSLLAQSRTRRYFDSQEQLVKFAKKLYEIGAHLWATPLVHLKFNKMVSFERGEGYSCGIYEPVDIDKLCRSYGLDVGEGWSRALLCR